MREGGGREAEGGTGLSILAPPPIKLGFDAVTGQRARNFKGEGVDGVQVQGLSRTISEHPQLCLFAES